MQEIGNLQEQAIAEVELATSTAELKELKIKFLGSNGLISGKLREVGSYQGDKRAFGQAVNEAKKAVEEALENREGKLKGGEMTLQFERERIENPVRCRASFV